MRKFIDRENEIFDILEGLLLENLEFIIVGGYAVSSYKHRFSVDADIVIKKEDQEKFEKILKEKKFKQQQSRILENIYDSEFMRYEKKDPAVSVDLLINGLVSRTTDASFSFDLISKDSQKRKIIGIEKEIEARIPSKELLIAMKLHSGRLTDIRDIAALAKNTDLEKIKKLILKGNLEIVRKNLKELKETIKDKNFIDSFKGVFIEKKFDIDLKQLEKISELHKEI